MNGLMKVLRSAIRDESEIFIPDIVKNRSVGLHVECSPGICIHAVHCRVLGLEFYQMNFDRINSIGRTLGDSPLARNANIDCLSFGHDRTLAAKSETSIVSLPLIISFSFIEL